MKYFYAALFLIAGTVVMILRPHRPRHIWYDGAEWVCSYGCMLYPFEDEL
jgi:hypothetical protein